MGKNFRVTQGQVMNLKFSATAIDSTEDFDAMNFESRLCNENIEDGEINCLMHQIIDRAKNVCACQPWYTFELGDQQCDSLGTLCYEKAILNGPKNMSSKNQCYESCKNIKYSLILQDTSIMDNILRMDMDDTFKYGDDFKDYFLRSKRLSHYMDHSYNQNGFVLARLRRSSLIHINFEESKVLTVTKDAKDNPTRHDWKRWRHSRSFH